MKEGNLKRFEELLRSVFSSIPYEWYRKNNIAEYKGYYASVVYSFLVGTGLEVVAEDYTNRGRIDLAVEVEDKAYLIEFKVVESEGESPIALESLKERKYEEKYLRKIKEIYPVGIDFSKSSKNVVNFEWVKI